MLYMKPSIKTFRNLEICQYLEFAPHLSTPEQVEYLVKKLDYIDKYAFIYHTEDEKHPHIHIMLKFTQPKTMLSVAKDFSVDIQYVERIKSTFNKALAYLTHANTPEKHQYSVKDVYTNILEIDKITNRERKVSLDDIYDKIDSGEIRQYNIVKYLSVKDYVENKRKIETAFSYYQKKNRNYDRKMSVVYIFGASGSGKTRLAKKLLKYWNKDFYLSSGGKNMLDDYGGEPAILLDDFRDTILDHTDFLKLLDPFTSSMAGARYVNKAIYCDTIIITSVCSPESLYAFNDEDKVQILRRLPIVIEIKSSDNTIEISYFNSELGSHFPSFSASFNVEDIESIAKELNSKIKEINSEES